ncbi:hypothetical protein DH2020_009978 [Rehmannia glutinosa]|uniref:Cytochrome b5 heme-binding domain-containing protein n=1 Tax=Rehmannia glutinosa TaxID=99300 RepID=A0ABR0XA43_REHGL
MALQLWETFKESITVYTGLSPSTFFTAIAVGLALYYVVLNLSASSSSDDGQGEHGSSGFEEKMKPLPPPVQLGEISVEELKQYDGSDPNKPLLMAIKGQIYDVTQGRSFFSFCLVRSEYRVSLDGKPDLVVMFYGPGGPYALFAGKDASRALAKMSFEDKDLNGDLTGLGVFELEALQDWEYKFMSKYVKVGTVKTSVPVTEGQTTDAAESDVAKPAENGPSERASKETEETTPAAGDAEKKE